MPDVTASGTTGTEQFFVERDDDNPVGATVTSMALPTCRVASADALPGVMIEVSRA